MQGRGVTVEVHKELSLTGRSLLLNVQDSYMIEYSFQLLYFALMWNIEHPSFGERKNKKSRDEESV